MAVSADPDGDGWTNTGEYVFGTDPESPDTSPIHTSEITGGSFTLTLTDRQASGSGYSGLKRYYDVMTTTDLSNAASWTGVAGYTNIIGANQSVTVTQPLTGGSRFYRYNIPIKP